MWETWLLVSSEHAPYTWEILCENKMMNMVKRFSAASTYHFTISLDNHHMCVILYGDRILINIVIRFSAASTYILSYHYITTTVIPLTSSILVSLFLWEAKAINILSMLNMKLKQLSMAPNYLGHIFFFSYLERGGETGMVKTLYFAFWGTTYHH